MLLVDGLTKSFRYPGWRLVWIAGPQAMVETIARAASAIDGGPSRRAQRAARADQETAAVRDEFCEKRHVMVQRLRPFDAKHAAGPGSPRRDGPEGVMNFRPDPPPSDQPPPRERRLWGRLLLLSAAVTAVATRWPWMRVKFERLFGEHSGPPGWQTTVGFTCLCTSMMVAMMALVESGTPASQKAVRPGSLMLVGIALLTLVFAGLQGPGTLGSVSADWTEWFYTVCISLPVLSFVCLQRWAAMKSGSQPQS